MGDTSVPVDILQEYTYEELKKATGNFSKDSELGRGAFGVVYKVRTYVVHACVRAICVRISMHDLCICTLLTC